jgi:hypothetical protein
MQRKPDIALAQDKLGWAPKIALEDGLKETIAYFRKTLAHAQHHRKPRRTSRRTLSPQHALQNPPGREIQNAPRPNLRGRLARRKRRTPRLVRQ